MEQNTYKKIREYKRDTVCKTLIEFLERCKMMNSNSLGVDHVGAYCNIKEATIFGSFVNSDKEKVHDLDIHLVLARSEYCGNLDDKERNRIAMKFAPAGADFITQICYLFIGSEKYLKNKSPILSLDTGDDVEDLTGYKVKIIDEYEFLTDNIQKVFDDNHYEYNAKSLL